MGSDVHWSDLDKFLGLSRWLWSRLWNSNYGAERVNWIPNTWARQTALWQEGRGHEKYNQNNKCLNSSDKSGEGKTLARAKGAAVKRSLETLHSHSIMFCKQKGEICQQELGTKPNRCKNWVNFNYLGRKFLFPGKFIERKRYCRDLTDIVIESRVVAMVSWYRVMNWKIEIITTQLLSKTAAVSSCTTAIN